jgi:hypothetical protein
MVENFLHILLQRGKAVPWPRWEEGMREERRKLSKENHPFLYRRYPRVEAYDIAWNI